MEEMPVEEPVAAADSIRAASSIAYGQVRSPTPSSSPTNWAYEPHADDHCHRPCVR